MGAGVYYLNLTCVWIWSQLSEGVHTCATTSSQLLIFTCVSVFFSQFNCAGYTSLMVGGKQIWNDFNQRPCICARVCRLFISTPFYIIFHIINSSGVLTVLSTMLSLTNPNDELCVRVCVRAHYSWPPPPPLFFLLTTDLILSQCL